MDSPEKSSIEATESSKEAVKLDRHGLPLIPQPSDDPEDVRQKSFQIFFRLFFAAAQLEPRAEVHYRMYCIAGRIYG